MTSGGTPRRAHGLVKPMKPCFNVWIEVEGEVALSAWRVGLLEGVARTGSISRAAEEQGVHFRVAWRKIKEMEQRLGTRLVVGHAGGAGGGGAALTPEAEAMIARFRAFTAGLDAEIRARYQQHFGAMDAEPADGGDLHAGAND